MPTSAPPPLILPFAVYEKRKASSDVFAAFRGAEDLSVNTAGFEASDQRLRVRRWFRLRSKRKRLALLSDVPPRLSSKTCVYRQHLARFESLSGPAKEVDVTIVYRPL